MKKYIPLLLFLSVILIVAGDQLQFGALKNKSKGSPDEKPTIPSSLSKDHDLSQHPDAEHFDALHPQDDHSDPEKNRRMGIFHFNEGNKYLRQGKWEDAVKNYEMALHHNKEFQETYINLSTTYLRAKKYDEALKTLRSLEKINASHPLLHYNLACYYSLTKQPKASLDSLKKAVDLGYKEFQEIQTDPDLENLRNETEFQKWFQELQREHQG